MGDPGYIFLLRNSSIGSRQLNPSSVFSAASKTYLSIEVVLLDRRLVESRGEDLLLQRRQLGYDQPIALVTAVEPDVDILEMGVDDYVVKPVGKDELNDVVETMLLRKEYDEVMREYFSLVSKVTTLQVEKESAVLEADESYLRSQHRLDEIKEQARTALNVAISEGKFDELFREVDPPTTETGRT